MPEVSAMLLKPEFWRSRWVDDQRESSHHHQGESAALSGKLDPQACLSKLWQLYRAVGITYHATGPASFTSLIEEDAK